MVLNRCVSTPSLLIPIHCRVGVSTNDWGMVMKLFKPVSPTDSSRMDVLSDGRTVWPERCHTSLGDGFPLASQEHMINFRALLQLEEGETWGASERDREKYFSALDQTINLTEHIWNICITLVMSSVLLFLDFSFYCCFLLLVSDFTMLSSKIIFTCLQFWWIKLHALCMLF